MRQLWSKTTERLYMDQLSGIGLLLISAVMATQTWNEIYGIYSLYWAWMGMIIGIGQILYTRVVHRLLFCMLASAHHLALSLYYFYDGDTGMGVALLTLCAVSFYSYGYLFNEVFLERECRLED